MNDSKLTIICSNCQNVISINDALKGQLTQEIEQTYKSKFNELYKTKTDELQKQFESDKKKDLDKELKLAEERIKSKLSEDTKLEVQFLKEQNEKQMQQLEVARKIEIDIRKQRAQLELDQKNLELDKQRQLDLEREKIKEDAYKAISEEYKWIDAQKEKKLQDVVKANEELTRKLQQGSQQTQGEVVELEIEELLHMEFPYDDIKPVQKGVNGADILQIVHDRSGRTCGIIAWESKHTKSWSEGWIDKLKDDQRKAKAEVAVIVTTVLPKDIKTFKFKDGIWITNFDSFIGLAMALRSNLIQISTIKQSMVGKNEKMEVLYAYLTGAEFKHKVETIVESFVALKNDLEKEKRAYQKIWATREKQIQRIIESTIGMNGDLEGLIGNDMPKLTSLELDSTPEML